ncbi:Protease HtpX [bioreactor metagenome]|uniref:Protease HtpX n=1 Tax=bioreactor metagenome TaxID=1076179 RepID=A0A644WRM3_9ZZZZ
MASTIKSIEAPAFQRTSGSKKTEGKDARDFALGVDALIIKALNNPAVNKVFKSFVQVSIDAQFGLNLAQGIPINHTTAPELYTTLRYCSETLGIPVPYTIISSAVSGVNAMTAGTDEFAFIAVSGLIPALFTVEEQRFILGHECGHLALGHVVYHTAVSMLGGAAQLVPVVGSAIAKAMTFPLQAWSRRSELSADRAGLICCGDLDTASKTLVKLELGLGAVTAAGNAPKIDVDVKDYVNAANRMLSRNTIGKYGELLHSHPLLSKRIEALELFAQSELYCRFTEQEAPAGVRLLSDEELNQRTENLVKVLE